jgi:hypothetical protein
LHALALEELPEGMAWAIFVARAIIQQLFLRRLLRRTYGFGIVFFGLPGSLNDINVLQRSHIFSRLVSDDALACNYIVNGREYNMRYYLADGIYLEWATLVKTIRNPKTRAEAEFAKRHKRHPGKTWRDLSVFCKQYLQ